MHTTSRLIVNLIASLIGDYVFSKLPTHTGAVTTKMLITRCARTKKGLQTPLVVEGEFSKHESTDAVLGTDLCSVLSVSLSSSVIPFVPSPTCLLSMALVGNQGGIREQIWHVPDEGRWQKFARYLPEGAARMPVSHV